MPIIFAMATTRLHLDKCMLGPAGTIDNRKRVFLSDWVECPDRSACVFGNDQATADFTHPHTCQSSFVFLSEFHPEIIWHWHRQDLVAGNSWPPDVQQKDSTKVTGFLNHSWKNPLGVVTSINTALPYLHTHKPYISTARPGGQSTPDCQ